MSTLRPDPYAPTGVARAIESAAAGLLAILWVLPLALLQYGLIERRIHYR